MWIMEFWNTVKDRESLRSSICSGVIITNMEILFTIALVIIALALGVILCVTSLALVIMVKQLFKD